MECVYTSVTEPELDTFDGLDAYLQKSVRLSGTILAAQSGDESCVEELRDMGRVQLAFPARSDEENGRTLAMGYALKYVEDAEEVGVSAEREYISEEGDYHRIDIIFGGEE